MLELRQLVKRYVDNGIDYATFRREFVTRFVAVVSKDTKVDASVLLIESLCADVAEREICSEELLKDALDRIVSDGASANGSPNPVQFLDVPANGNCSVSSCFSSAGANTSPQLFTS
jgi:hypothetical protein